MRKPWFRSKMALGERRGGGRDSRIAVFVDNKAQNSIFVVRLQ